jgi:DNA-binding transcriptional LysR family regulator
MASPDLKIRQVEAFRALMQRHTVTRAAQMLHISQPAMSRLIADFEERAGFALFTRQQGRLMPTVEANVLYAEVERAFVGLDSITQAAQQIRAMRRGSLRIAGSPAVALEWLPRVLTSFAREHPGVDITLLTHSSSTVVQLVASQRIDIGFIAEAMPHPAVRLDRLTHEPMRCILPAGHRLARKRILKPEDLRDEPFVSFPLSFDARRTIDRVFVEHGVARQMTVEAQLSQTIVAFVAQGAGVALIDPVTASFAGERVAVRRFEPAIADELYLVSAVGLPVSSLVTAFAADMKLALEKIKTT